MKNIWLYTPEICDGDFCPKDCDACPKKELIFEREEGESMTDYISRQAAVDALAGWKISPIVLDPVPSVDVVEADKAQKEIDYWHDKAQSYEQTILKLSLNKADVVEVVRCKDCKWWDNEDDAERCTHKYGGMWAKPDEYCSYGERTEE